MELNTPEQSTSEKPVGKQMKLLHELTLKKLFERGDAFPCDRKAAEDKLKEGHDVYFSSVRMADGSDKEAFGYALAVYT